MKMTSQEREAFEWASRSGSYTGMDGIAARVLAGYIRRCGINAKNEDMDPARFTDWIRRITNFLLEQVLGGDLGNDIEVVEQAGRLQAGMNIINSVIETDQFWVDYLGSRGKEET